MTLPFAGLAKVAVVLPDTGLTEGELRHLRALLQLHRVELARELGAPLDFAAEPAGALWLIGPAASNPGFARLGLRPAASPVIVIDRSRRLLASDAPTLAGVMSTLWRLFELSRLGDGEHATGECASLEAAVVRLAEEVRATHPSLATGSGWWDERSADFAPRVLADDDPIAVFQEWLAGLADGHSFVRRIGRTARMPYGLRADGDAVVFAHVESDTIGAHAGLVAGSCLLGVDLKTVAARVATRFWRRHSSALHPRCWRRASWRTVDSGRVSFPAANGNRGLPESLNRCVDSNS